MGLVYAFLYAPIVVMIFFSFNSAKSTTKFEGFSLKWYEELFRKPEVIEALMNTLILALASAAIATILGTLAAVGINMVKNGFYKHFKGNVYEVLGTAKHSETLEEYVVYRATYGEKGMWIRPASMWDETVVRDGVEYKRFSYIGESYEEEEK